MLLGSRRSRALHDNDTGTIWRPDGRVVECAVGGKRHGTALPVYLDLFEGPSFIRPGHVREPLPVGRPRRDLLLGRVGGQTPRRAVGQIHEVEAVERAERQSLSIWRR